MDDMPSTSYTIDDLEFLMAASAADPRTRHVEVLLSTWDEEIEEEAAQRDPSELIVSPAPSERPRYRAERLLATCSADVRTLRALADSRFSHVRQAVADNPHTPIDTLRRLASSEHGTIAATACAHPAITSADLEFVILTSDNEWTLAACLDSPVMSRELLERLTNHPNAAVRAGAAKRTRNADALAVLARDADDWVRAGVAVNRNINIDVAEQLITDPAPAVRIGLALNPAAPPTVHASLATDEDQEVRQLLARTPWLPGAAALRLATDPDETVRYWLARNQATPAAALTTLTRRRRSAAGPANGWDIRREVATNPACPPKLRQRLADKDPSVTVQDAAIAWGARP